MATAFAEWANAVECKAKIVNVFDLDRADLKRKLDVIDWFAQNAFGDDFSYARSGNRNQLFYFRHKFQSVGGWHDIKSLIAQVATGNSPAFLVVRFPPIRKPLDVFGFLINLAFLVNCCSIPGFHG